MAKKMVGLRLSPGTIAILDWFAKHLEDQGYGEKSQADIVELALGNLYKFGIPGLIEPPNKTLDLKPHLEKDMPPSFPDPEPKTAGRKPYKNK